MSDDIIASRAAIAKRALGLLDLTDLSDNCNHAAIDDLCQRAITPHGTVAAICIWPRFVAHAYKQLADTDITIATVVNFPSGNQNVDITLAETKAALEDGADEIDLVLPYTAFKKGDVEEAATMVRAIADLCQGKALLKVIIEAGELGSAALVRQASQLAIDHGADFIKTSTGKVAVNATLETAEQMIGVIAEQGDTSTFTSMCIGFKPAGGIKTTGDCGAYLALADRIMGPDWANPRTFRFGASSVLADLLAALEGEEQVQSSGY